MRRVYDIRPLRFIRLLSAFAAAWLSLTSAALAHASLTGTTPGDGSVVAAPPAVFSLSFSEPVSPLALNLIRPDGNTKALSKFSLRDRTVEIDVPSDLSDGTHVLTWRVVSGDGHPVGGSVIFSIGAPSAAPPAVVEAYDPVVRAGLWITKVALYIGLFFGIGGAVAVAWLVPRSRSGSRLAGIALAIGFAGTALSPGFQGIDALGATAAHFVDPLMWRTGFDTSYGRTVVAMLVALFCAIFGLLVSTGGLARLLSVAGVVIGAGALALSGHASAAAPQWLTQPSVFAHAAMITLWVGALPPLGLALRLNRDDAAMALHRFSTFIPYAVLLLIVSGLALAIIQVQRPAALVETAYGQLLVVKLALLVLLFALAALNRYRLTKGAEDGEVPARRALVKAIGTETLLVLLIFGIAAGWRFTPPPRSLAIAVAQPVAMHIHTAKAMADVTVTPGRVGPVAISAILMTGEFGPLDAREVTFVLSNPAAGIEPFRRSAEKPGDGTWRAEEVVLPLPGTWTLRIDILITDFEMARIEGEVEIRP